MWKISGNPFHENRVPIFPDGLIAFGSNDATYLLRRTVVVDIELTCAFLTVGVATWGGTGTGTHLGDSQRDEIVSEP
jgi:hypothetical protein